MTISQIELENAAITASINRINDARGKLAIINRRETLLAELNHSTWALIVDASANVFGVTSEQIMGRSRPENVAMARHAAISIIHDVSDESTIDIGRYFSRDHTTILHSLKVASDRLQVDPVFKKKYETIQAIISETK